MIMRKLFISVLTLVVLSAPDMSAKTPKTEKSKADTTTTQEEKKQTVKTGWNVAPFPSVAYNSDTGFQIGALCELFYYGDGSTYPGYMHKFNVDLSYSTGGQVKLHFFYDSKYLIPKVRLTAAATYLLNTMYPFYGFNGNMSPVNMDYNSNKENRTAFYNVRRNMLRVMADFQGNIYKDSFRWAAGISYWYYKVQDITGEKLVGPKGKYDLVNNQVLTGNNIHSSSLYQLYQKAGLISPEEAGGGSHIELKAGVVFDNREHEADPTRGIWTEVYAYGSPDIFQGRNHYLKLAAHFRHYVPLWQDKIVFAYHAAYQGRLAGDAPFYTLQNISTLYLRQIVSDGIGSINTVRGMNYNRVVGDGYAWANFEMRFKLVSFKFIKQNWYLATNPFFDMGACVQPYRLSEMQQIRKTHRSLDGTQVLTDNEVGLIYTGEKEKLHMSAGFGVKLVMNRNFILSAEFAFPFLQEQDGKFGTNIGLNYIF